MGAMSPFHSHWGCGYYIIFIPKTHRKVFFKEVSKEVGELLRTQCEYNSVELVKRSIHADPIHIYLKVLPKWRF
jgi:putative transposase